MPSRRGFSNERHGPLKVALSGVAIAGFASGWYAFTAGHAADASTPIDVPSATAVPTATPTVARGGSTTVAPATATTAAPRRATPAATAARRTRAS